MPVDFSRSSRLLLRQAAALARELSARLTLMYIQPPDWAGEDADDPQLVEAYQDLGREALTRLEELRVQELEGLTDVNLLFRVGQWTRQIIATARAEESDLIATPEDEETGFFRWFYPTTTDQLIRQAPCPVLLWPIRLLAEQRSRSPARHGLMVAASLSENSRRAVQHGAVLALRLDTPLLVLHLRPPLGQGKYLTPVNALTYQKEILTQTRRQFLDWLPPEMARRLHLKVILRTGCSQAHVLDQHLRHFHPSLIVIGGSARGWWRRRFTHIVLRQTNAPVLFVGPSAPQTPR